MPSGIGFPSSPLSVWSIEENGAQFAWGDLPAGHVTASAQDSFTKLDHPGGAGCIAIDGLSSNSPQEATIKWESCSGKVGLRTLKFKTLKPPPGQRLARFATVSDLHLGSVSWGALKTMEESKLALPALVRKELPPVPSAFHCASSAMSEALQWGASAIVVKGDIAHHRTRNCFSEVDRLVDLFPDVTLLMIPGNHDVDVRSSMPVPSTFGTRKVPFIRSVDHLDLPGLRILVADTSIPQEGPGRVSIHQDQLLDAARDAARRDHTSSFVAVHHHFQDWSYPTYWPPGIPAPESTNFLDALSKAAPNALVSSGHTHRNRVKEHSSITVSQVGSTRDWPGVWAGYSVYEGGISQIIRRIATPGAVHWHEYSKDAVGGLWRFWASGRLSQRCFTKSWI